MLLKRGIDAGTRAVVDEIKKLAIPVKGHSDIEHIAAIAANDPEIGKLLAQAMDKVGHDGVITVEEGKGLKIEDMLIVAEDVDAEALALGLKGGSPHRCRDSETGVAGAAAPACGECGPRRQRGGRAPEP